jgi:hypothetical protein
MPGLCYSRVFSVVWRAARRRLAITRVVMRLPFVRPSAAVAPVSTAVSSVEEVQQRTGQEQQVGQHAENVCRVLGQDEEPRDEQES